MPRFRVNPNGSHAARRGFTLVEVVTTIAILAAVMSVSATLIFTSTSTFAVASTRAQLHSELSVAMDRIQRELQKIPIKTSYASIAPNISSVTASSIAWNSNYSLTLSSGRVMFVDNGSASSILLSDVTGFVVQTYNESNTALGATLSGAGCDTIRRISIEITLQRSGVTETLRGRMFIRGTMEDAG